MNNYLFGYLKWIKKLMIGLKPVLLFWLFIFADLPCGRSVGLPFNPFFMKYFRYQPLVPTNVYSSSGNSGESTYARDSRDTRFLTPGDFEKSRQVPDIVTTEEGIQAMQIPTLFEGDITGFTYDRRLHDSPMNIFGIPQNSALNLGTYPDKLWKNGRIPYVLEEDLEEHQRIAIAQAFDEYKNKTCVEYVPKEDNDYDYIVIRRNKNMGCSSYVGRAGGNQTISLEVGKCFTKGIVAHELMHSLGFFHEHSRTDRDKFVNIVEDNVKPDPTAEIGQRYRLSEIDAKKVNKLYQCDKKKKVTEEGGSSEEKGEEEECDDLNEHCDMWAEIGHCKWSEKYMSHYCKKSCGVCDIKKSGPIRPNSRCLDQNLFCGYWARIGECKSESKFMKIFCKRSCGICSD